MTSTASSLGIHREESQMKVEMQQWSVGRTLIDKAKVVVRSQVSENHPLTARFYIEGLHIYIYFFLQVK